MDTPKIEHPEQRMHTRKRIYPTRGELKDTPSGTVYVIELLDISVAGLSFLSPSPYSKSKVWIISFPLSNEQIAASIQIVDCIKHNFFNEAYRVSAMFKYIDPLDVETIQRCMETYSY